MNPGARGHIVAPVKCVASLGVVAAAVLLSGCGGSKKAAEVQGSFVGEVAGSTAFVAVVAGKGNVAAYVCDGAHGVAELFTGPRSGSSVALTAKDGSKLDARLAAGKATGSVTVGGTKRTFTADPAEGKAGFYRAIGKVQGKEATAGWVVLADGRQRGALRTTTVLAAPTLNTATQTATLGSGGTISPVLITPTQASRAGLQGGFGGGFSG
ncbi:MAG: hypothetical protein QOE36_817 [Gaiellaceae bacterium]|nr:hypothetical protein [Gaiellaceae bacterium]